MPHGQPQDSAVIRPGWPYDARGLPKGTTPCPKRERPAKGDVDPLRVGSAIRVVVQSRWQFDSARFPADYPPEVTLGHVTREEPGSDVLVLHDSNGEPIARYRLVCDPGAAKPVQRSAYRLLQEL